MAAEECVEVDKKDVYLPGKPLEEGETLVCDKSAYVMLHAAQTSSPCLSFDIIPDTLGNDRNDYPLSMYVVAGTQSPEKRKNNLIVMKLFNLHKTQTTESDEDSDELSDDESESLTDKNPQMLGATVVHRGCVNRIKCAIFKDQALAAVWSELGAVSIWSLKNQLKAVESSNSLSYFNQNLQKKSGPIFTFKGHQTEGYAVEWCPIMKGVLATGDCQKNIHIWKPSTDGASSWCVDQRPLIGHSASVEDIQWSPHEANVMASCSVDRSIRIWDIRAPPSKACMLANVNAHTDDINTISWNRYEPFIVSGGDDGFIHVWDLRKFEAKSTSSAVATFKHHTDYVTCVEWHPTDTTVFAASGADNQITLWDLSVEKDDDAENVEGIPPQLLFIHLGQNNIKELHWHKQIPGVIVSTAESGFNVFKTISV